ncbi:hypothetical protein DXG03_006164 [Asterophora parasitica]|uniref:C3H1-type domain-containing protein n=1 Tax=Asterophora parasitica TaxID=117018 RepID=A0A9P7KG41_9AGAR|nr:hypothetical protein DXG03_006164 [Asterophora parasitica]
MPTRTENNRSDRQSAWRFNTNGQLVDETAGWDLADEIVRLKIGEGDSEDVHSQIRTPPKSKMASVAHLSEASPLETSSNTSISSSPQASEHEISVSHSRGSSTDTTISSSQESVGSVPSNPLLTKPPLTVNTGNEIKERPHSFSGGLSSADLRRLQQAGDAPDAADRQRPQQYRENANAELSYPSITSHIHRPQPQPHPQMFDYRNGQSQLNQSLANHDEQLDYTVQQRNFNPVSQGHPLAPPAFVQGRPNNNLPPAAYRQLPRGFQGMVATPPAMAYPGHTTHLSLGNTQQLYDMMLPAPHHDGHHPAVARVQQQHNVFRPTHQHSASDPSAAIRDAAAMALMGNTMPFPGGLFQPGLPAMAMYSNQYYPPQEQYPIPDAAVRLQSQYTGQYAVVPPQGIISPEVSSPTSTNGQGPSANNRKLGLYKTELCRSWEEKGTCRYGTKCQFAHGEDELRKVARHPKYKTEICRTFWVSGTCPYGKRCCFIHTELPTSGAAGTAGGGTPPTDSAPQQRDGRSRSLSTNSDPNEASVSLLARISGKRGQDATPVDNNTFQFGRPGALRVDTSAIETNVKQNKSAYPTFASNGILLPATEQKRPKSPAPVTAGPDLGRHNNVRREIVGHNNNQQQPQTQRTHKSTASSSSVRHSEAETSFSGSSHSSFALSEGPSRPNGHVRSGSAGNWGSFSRSSQLSQSGEIMANSPWSSTELAVGSSRLHEKVWA